MGAKFFYECYNTLIDFALVMFEHHPREDNGVAHELDRLARYESPNTWLDEPPQGLISFLVNDVSMIINE